MGRPAPAASLAQGAVRSPLRRYEPDALAMQVGRRDVILRIASFEWGSPDRFSAAGRYLDDADDPGDERDVRSWPSVSTCTVGDDWTRVPR